MFALKVAPKATFYDINLPLYVDFLSEILSHLPHIPSSFSGVEKSVSGPLMETTDL